MISQKPDRPRGEAERLMAAGFRDHFDDTEWRRQGLPHISLEALATGANSRAQQIDQDG